MRAARPPGTSRLPPDWTGGCFLLFKNRASVWTSDVRTATPSGVPDPEETPEPPQLSFRTRALLFLLFAGLSYGSYYLLAKDPLGYRFHFGEARALPSPSPRPVAGKP